MNNPTKESKDNTKRKLIIWLALTMIIVSQMGCKNEAPSWGGISTMILLVGVLVLAIIRTSRKIKIAP